jgi:hypothetical protein
MRPGWYCCCVVHNCHCLFLWDIASGYFSLHCGIPCSLWQSRLVLECQLDTGTCTVLECNMIVLNEENLTSVTYCQVCMCVVCHLNESVGCAPDQYKPVLCSLAWMPYDLNVNVNVRRVEKGFSLTWTIHCWRHCSAGMGCVNEYWDVRCY